VRHEDQIDVVRDMNTLIDDPEQAFDTTGLGPEVRAFVADAQWLRMAGVAR
jgi:hypothetical protein